jgi:hypothetical protein
MRMNLSIQIHTIQSIDTNDTQRIPLSYPYKSYTYKSYTRYVEIEEKLD